MPRILFTADFNWSPRPAVTIAYKAGNEYPVTQACADAALAAGKGAKPPRRKFAEIKTAEK